MVVSQHFQTQYQAFQEWFNKQPTLSAMMTYYQDRHNDNPTIINPEIILFEAFTRGWLSKEQQQQKVEIKT